ncbi:MAG: hypothetical protein ABJN26_02230 [Stappiaceae bacterium]
MSIDNVYLDIRFVDVLQRDLFLENNSQIEDINRPSLVMFTGYGADKKNERLGNSRTGAKTCERLQKNEEYGKILPTVAGKSGTSEDSLVMSSYGGQSQLREAPKRNASSLILSVGPVQ